MPNKKRNPQENMTKMNEMLNLIVNAKANETTTHNNGRGSKVKEVERDEVSGFRIAYDGDLIRKDWAANAVYDSVDLEELDDLVVYFNKCVEKKRKSLSEVKA